MQQCLVLIGLIRSDTDTGLVGVLCHEVHEYLVGVEVFPVHAGLGLHCSHSVRVLDPDVALVVLLDEDALDDSILLRLLLDVLL